jgi:hypothetical protein
MLELIITGLVLCRTFFRLIVVQAVNLGKTAKVYISAEAFIWIHENPLDGPRVQ